MKGPTQKRRKLAQYLGLLIFIVLGSMILRTAALNLDFLSPFQKTLENFDVSDYAFKKFKQDKYFEREVIMVNFGYLDRAGIAELIDSISAHKPKVIGLDALFYNPKNPAQDFKLFTALKNAGNVILSSKLDSLQDDGTHAYNHEPYALFHSVTKSAYANLITGLEHGFRTSRNITVDEHVRDSLVWSFPAEIVRSYDPEAFEVLEKRNKEQEVINWVGNIDSFYRLNYTDVLAGGRQLDLFKDKIVIVGYLGPELGEVKDFEDAFFTPLNENPVGRAFPDMYGPVIHANAVSMFLKQKYIAQVPEILCLIMGVFFMLFNAFIFQRVMWWKPNAFELFSRVVQLLQLVILWGVAIYLLAYKSIKIDMSYSLFAVVLSADFADLYESSIAPRLKRFLDWLNRRKLA